MYYRAEKKAVCADVIPFYENGEFKLFYLRDYRDIENDGEGCPWCLLTTKDLVHYTDHGVVLPRGREEEQDLYVFTGSCIRRGDEYYIFYTGHNPHLRAQGLAEQKILLARSRDLLHWEKVKDFVFASPDWMELHDFRDPFVYFDEEKRKYAMLIAGRLKNTDPVDTRGVTMVAYSDDLFHWDLAREPFYAPHAYFTHECPDLFRMGDWWYLIFSEFSEKVTTTYRMSKSPDGPWITPKVNTFDGHAFYAAKSVSDGKRRILFGWNCIKDKEEDNAPWQWGGTVIPHEIVQAEDGTLYVKCPDEVAAQYSRKQEILPGFALGDTEALTDGYRLGGEGRNIRMLGTLPENAKITMNFRSDGRGEFGLILRESENLGVYYCVKFEPMWNRLTFDRRPRKDSTVHSEVAVERYCPLRDGENRLTVIVEGSVLEVYVNDRVAMSARMFDHRSGNWGVYSLNGAAEFSGIGLYTKEDAQ